MDTNRFRKRSDYTYTPPRRVAPVMDEMGNLRKKDLGIVQDLSTVQFSENKDLSEPKLSAQNADQGPTQAKTSVLPKNIPETLTINPKKSESKDSATISLQLNIPKLHKPKLPDLPYKKIVKWVTIIVVIVAVIIIGIFTVKHFFSHPKPLVSFSKDGHVLAAAKITKPTFTPIGPKNKQYLATGGTGTSFDGTRDSYSYSDIINGTILVVSEQPLPPNFSTPVQAISSIAKSIGANTAIPTTSGEPAYMATNTKSSTQTIVYTKNDLLIFLISNFPHDVPTWSIYINSLQ